MSTAPPPPRSTPPRLARCSCTCSGATTNSLLLDVTVSVSRPAGDRLFDRAQLQTDASGSALFEQLPPARVTARIQRGGMGGASQRVEVIAGQRSERT